MARRKPPRPTTSDQVKDWERERRSEQAARRAAREDTGVGGRLREAKPVATVSFEAVGRGLDGLERRVRCGLLTEQQRRSLTQVFEADGYTVVKGRAG